MFTNLMASAPVRRFAPIPATASVVFHAAVIGAFAWGAAHGRTALQDAPVAYVEMTSWVEPPAASEEPAPPPAPEPTPAAAMRDQTPAEAGFQEITAPKEILAEIPPAAKVAVRAADFTGEGVPGGFGGAHPLTVAPSSLARPSAPPPLSVDVVDEVPQVVNREEIANVMQRLFPPHARILGIGGDAVVRFVVGVDGQVEAEGIAIEQVSDPEFEAPTLAVVRQLRFRPGRRNGKTVRVWVRLPMSWSMTSP